MPRSKSAKKHLRQTKRRTGLNKAQRSRLRTSIKAVRQAQSPQDREAAFLTAERLLDRAGRKQLIHPNVAARLKRRLSRRVKAGAGA